MNSLTIVLILKIVLTLLFWCGPLLLLPSTTLVKLGFPLMMPDIYLKLLGWAYLALVVGYSFGLKDIINGGYPLSAIWVGIVSNGGASLLLLIYGIQGSWNTWGAIAQTFMWVSMSATGAITLALIWFRLTTNSNQALSL